LRGTKLSLYEGGIRMPFIIRWPGNIHAATIDSTSVIYAADLLPSFCNLAGVKLPQGIKGDGENRASVLLGKPSLRSKEIFWEYGRNETVFKYPQTRDRSPSLAVRKGQWKLLINADGSRVELYDIVKDREERNNLVAREKEVADGLTNSLLNWWKTLPRLTTN